MSVGRRPLAAFEAAIASGPGARSVVWIILFFPDLRIRARNRDEAPRNAGPARAIAAPRSRRPARRTAEAALALLPGPDDVAERGRRKPSRVAP
jgi:hypothetical protein